MLLALEGGGMRGMMTVEVLEEIERLFKKELGKGNEFVLADYFDYIAGTSPAADGQLDPVAMHKLFQLKAVPAAFMFSALHEQDLLPRVFGKYLARDPLDRDLGDLIEKKGSVSQKLLTYVRYDAELIRTSLEKLG